MVTLKQIGRPSDRTAALLNYLLLDLAALAVGWRNAPVSP
jgi:hypothetical protein